MSTPTRQRSKEDCTPEARVTKSLLGYGVIVGPFYVLASVIDGLTRSGFDFSHDSWSLLSLGPRGWVHIVVFVLTGLMVIAAAIGIRRHVRGGKGDTSWGYLAFYGLALVLAGAFLPDLPSSTPTVHGVLHLAAGGLGFVGFAVTTFVLARRFSSTRQKGWAVFSIVSGVLLLVGFGVLATGSTSTVAVLGFTATVILSWVWLSVVSVLFYREAAIAGRIPQKAAAKVGAD
jgi:hypothetical membrane protein